jgi:hypothetical protein
MVYVSLEGGGEFGHKLEAVGVGVCGFVFDALACAYESEGYSFYYP